MVIKVLRYVDTLMFSLLIQPELYMPGPRLDNPDMLGSAYIHRPLERYR